MNILIENKHWVHFYSSARGKNEARGVHDSMVLAGGSWEVVPSADVIV